ncbi:MAG: hypothetical protein QOI98_161 [Solirubrobacteraceae bacterium]|jgi:hypothetical protein|nr:hypothetical protein [Solirubrobacteraceae bacterium]
MRLRAIPVLLAALGSAAPASAGAATWSPPVSVGSAATFIDDPFVGFGTSGRGIVAWHWQNGIGSTAQRGTRVATRAPSGIFGPEHAAPDMRVGPVVFSTGRVAMLQEVSSFRNGQERARVQVAFGKVTGAFAPPVTIDVINPAYAPALASNSSGDVAVAYIQRTHGGSRRVVTLAVRHRGGPIRSPRVVMGHGRANAVTVAVGRRGDIVVAWEKEGRVEARFQRHGHSLGPVQKVGSARKLGTQLRAAVSADGQAWIAWRSQTLTEGGGNGPFALKLAVSHARGRGFRTPLLLDSYDRRGPEQAGFDLALDPHGNGMIAWTTYDGTRFRARLGVANRSGSFRSFQNLSPPGKGAIVYDLAAGRTGEALVVWDILNSVGEEPGGVRAAYIPPNGVYGGEEDIGAGEKARVPAAAFNPVTGRPTVVWSERVGADGPGVPLAEVQTFVRSATRQL